MSPDSNMRGCVLRGISIVSNKQALCRETDIQSLMEQLKIWTAMVAVSKYGLRSPLAIY